MNWAQAVRQSEVEVVRSALQRGVAMQEITARLDGASWPILELLFDHGLDPNAPVPNPWSESESVPIPFAVFDGGRWSIEVLEKLIARGFDTWAPQHSRSLLSAVCGEVHAAYDRPNSYTRDEENRYFALAEQMLAGRTLRAAPYGAAAWWGTTRWIELLARTGASPSDDALTGWATKSADGVRLLLELGADPNGTSAGRPLIEAASIGDLEVVEMLVSAGADPRKSAGHDGRDAIGAAVRNGHDEVASFLRGEGAPSAFELILAVQRGNVPRLREMIEQGADPNGRDGAGRVPLTVAAEHGQIASVQALLELGADAGLLTKGRDALRVAALADQPAIAKLMLDLVGLTTPDANITALGAATWGRSVACIELFLGAGADPNEQFSPAFAMARTPILAAVELVNFGDWNAPRAVELLLDAGADPMIPGFKDWTCQRMIDAARPSPRVDSIRGLLAGKD